MNMELLAEGLPAEKRQRQTRTIAGSLKFAGDGAMADSRIVTCVASDESTDRMGDQLVAAGCILTNFLKNPVALAFHDATAPIGRVTSIRVVKGATSGDSLLASITFAPAGTSAKADETLALIRANVLSAVSVGFLPLAGEPIKGTGGYRFTKWELLELSIVSVPANANALVTSKDLADAREALKARARATLAEIAPPDTRTKAELIADVWETLRAARA